MSVGARSADEKFKGSERVVGNGVGIGKKVGNQVEGASVAGEWQWGFSSTGGKCVEGGAKSATAKAISAPTFVERPLVNIQRIK